MKIQWPIPERSNPRSRPLAATTPTAEMQRELLETFTCRALLAFMASILRATGIRYGTTESLGISLGIPRHSPISPRTLARPAGRIRGLGLRIMRDTPRNWESPAPTRKFTGWTLPSLFLMDMPPSTPSCVAIRHLGIWVRHGPLMNGAVRPITPRMARQIGARRATSMIFWKACPRMAYNSGFIARMVARSTLLIVGWV